MRKIAIVFLLALSSLALHAEPEHDLLATRPQTKSVQELEKESQEVASRIEELVKQAQDKNVEITHFQRTTVYQGDEKSRDIRQLHAEIKRLEQEIHLKRKALHDAISQVPEAKQLEDERRAIFKEIARLNTEKAAIDNELDRAKSVEKSGK